jgi:3-dehydroquinate dehydratase II
MPPSPRPVRIAVLHGPNLNLLGEREPAIYGRTTLAAIDAALREQAFALGAEVVSCAQHNSEGAMIDAVHVWRADGIQGALVNASDV